MNITVIGCGYVGLVTGACLAQIGHVVVCTDNDRAKIEDLTSGGIPIYEGGLDELVSENRRLGRLSFTADLGQAVRHGETIFICVGTPPSSNGDADVSAINRVAQLIAAEAQGPKLVVEKSTVPVQTGQQLKRTLAIYSRSRQLHFQVASNPEFLREGTAVLDFMHPSRIIIGVDEDSAERQLREIYAPLLDAKFRCPVHRERCPQGDPAPFLITSINSAELIKHASNSFLAIKISYANLLADLCDRLDASVEEVTAAVGLDRRIGADFLRPGLGFGGFCLPKDIHAFIHLGKRAGVDVSLLQAAEDVNRQRVARFVERIRNAAWVLKETRIGLLGLSFKPETDDVRFSPAIELARRLLSEGAEVRAYDPQAMPKAMGHLPVRFSESEYDAANAGEALVIATAWPQFKLLDWARIQRSMNRPLVLDSCNLLEPARMWALGFEYHSVGRPSSMTNEVAAGVLRAA